LANGILVFRLHGRPTTNSGNPADLKAFQYCKVPQSFYQPLPVTATFYQPLPATAKGKLLDMSYSSLSIPRLV
jgi:hypothetical protein